MTQDLRRPVGTAPVTEPFFHHRMAGPDTTDAWLNDTTRLMCAGAYLDPAYAAAVIAELVENEHRAVVPSAGFDLNPVLRHCFRACRIELGRKATLTVLLVAATVFVPSVVYVWAPLGAGLLAAAQMRGEPRQVRAVIGVGTAVATFLLCGLLLRLVSVLITEVAPGRLAIWYERNTTGGGWLPYLDTSLSTWVPVIMVAGLVIQTSFRARVYHRVTSELSHGARHRLPALPAGRVGRRVHAVASAQWGNLTLHAHRNPFLGAGRIVESWSLCFELKRRSQPEARVDVDPVEMHQVVRTQLENMRREPLRDRERVSGLVVRDHVVATGERRHDDVLLDPNQRRPYAEASREAIEAIIRHPQGSLRYYQRAVLGTEGKDIVVAPNHLVAPAQDQEIAVSTFLYLAVEGGLMYAEFVAAVLRPVSRAFHTYDRVSPEGVTGRALRDVFVRTPAELVCAPFRLVHAVVFGRYARRMRRADRRNQESYVDDYGARLSVRELASGTGPANYLQILDGEKYYKLAERTITKALLGYLRERDVDTEEFETRVTYVHNHGVMISGGTVSGPVAAGPSATATAPAPAAVG